jgi:protein-S-isoprenylcysteine O-methyltransferase Ste14
MKGAIQFVGILIAICFVVGMLVVISSPKEERSPVANWLGLIGIVLMCVALVLGAIGAITRSF